MELKINWSHKRCKHALRRMWLRGLSLDEVESGVVKGKKVIQKKTGLIESFHRFYSIVYDGLWDNIPILRHITLNFNAFKIFEI